MLLLNSYIWLSINCGTIGTRLHKSIHHKSWGKMLWWFNSTSFCVQKLAYALIVSVWYCKKLAYALILSGVWYCKNVLHYYSRTNEQTQNIFYNFHVYFPHCTYCSHSISHPVDMIHGLGLLGLWMLLWLLEDGLLPGNQLPWVPHLCLASCCECILGQSVQAKVRQRWMVWTINTLCTYPYSVLSTPVLLTCYLRMCVH